MTVVTIILGALLFIGVIVALSLRESADVTSGEE